MIRKLTSIAITALALSTGGALAAGSEGHVEDFSFSFEGPFGKYDQNQLQRGLKVYTEVCAACHGLKYVTFRALGEEGGLGYSEDEVRAYAAQFEVFDPALDDTRAATPADHFPSSSMETAPDLSLMAKARAGFHGPMGLGINQIVRGMGGAEYIASFLTGFSGEEKEMAGATFYENHTFSGGWTAMPPQLEDGLVEFDDGHDNSAHHMAQDVAAFLMWAAEPKMMARQHAGFLAVGLMILLSVLLYLTNKKIWYPIKHRKD